jgi:hypothetical protein
MRSFFEVPARVALVLLAPMVCAVTGCQEEIELPKVGGASLVKSGDKTLTIPPPLEMIRSDGIYTGWDTAMASALPKSHRLVAAYTTHEDRRLIERGEYPVFLRGCVLQVKTADEERDVGYSEFGGIKGEIKDEIQTMTRGIVAQLVKHMVQVAPESTATASNAKMLGSFEESKTSFGFTVSTDIELTSGKETVVAAVVVAAVNGRVLTFLALSAYEDEADRQWTEDTARLWCLLARTANPEYEGFRLGKWVIRFCIALILVSPILWGIYALFRRLKRLGQFDPL